MDGLIALNDHHRKAAPHVPVELHGGDIHPLAGEYPRHLGHLAGLVFVADDKGGQVAGEGGLQAVDGLHPHPAAPQRRSPHLHAVAVGGGEAEQDGVGMGPLEIHPAQDQLHPRLLRQREGVGQPGVVGGHVQQPRRQGLVRAVSGAGGGEGTVEQQLRPGRGTAQQTAGNTAQPGGSSGVGGGGADHHRAHNVKNGHASSSFLSFSSPWYSSGIRLEYTICCAL